MKRRELLKSLIGAPLAAALGIKAAKAEPKTPIGDKWISGVSKQITTNCGFAPDSPYLHEDIDGRIEWMAEQQKRKMDAICIKVLTG